MPRGPRVDFPGAVHHVYARGIEKRDIFFDDYDRCNFLDRIGTNLEKWGMRCCAWALMPNHFHLLIQSDMGRLPSFMHCLLTGYSRYFNQRHDRVGHLFQNRYKSPIVGKLDYCREVVRYIHLNPLRSGIVPSVEALEEYPWTGHRRIMRSAPPDWQDTELLQSEFDGSPHGDRWKTNYREYLEMKGENEVKSPIPEDAEEWPETGELGSPDAAGPHTIFLGHLRRISALHGIPVERVLSGDREYIVVKVRRAVLEKCRKQMVIPIAQLARWIGMKENSARYLLHSCR